MEKQKSPNVWVRITYNFVKKLARTQESITIEDAQKIGNWSVACIKWNSRSNLHNMLDTLQNVASHWEMCGSPDSFIQNWNNGLKEYVMTH